jgi:hypothetical protein
VPKADRRDHAPEPWREDSVSCRVCGDEIKTVLVGKVPYWRHVRRPKPKEDQA